MGYPEADTRFASLLMAIIQILCWIGFFNAKYGTFDPAVYEMYIGVALMMLVGFGYLMTFLKQYGLGAVGFTFILTALAVQINVLLTVYLSPSGGDVVVDPYYLMDGNFAAAAILISYGCMIGKASPSQLVIMTVIESIVFQINRNYICLEEFKVEDAGGTILIHLFGAYYGLAATKMLGKPKDPSGAESSSVTSDVLSLIGTVFLWLYWPSFNSGGFTGSATDAGRATANTIIGLIASCTFCFITSGLIGGRFNPADIQNATLAGGVAVGAVARMDIGLGWASVIGAAGGMISTLGYQFVQPFLQAKIGLHDSCGVHNLHGMPALFGGFISIIFVETNRDPGLANESGKAAGMQAAALGVTFVIAIVAGAITGVIIRVVKEFMKAKFYVPPPGQENLDKSVHFTDDRYWNVAPGSAAPDDKVTV
jgi:ammonium transporter Rh